MNSAPVIRSNPSILVKVYDVIQGLLKSQQLPSLSNIIRHPDLKNVDAENTIRLAVDDGLLLTNSKELYAIPSPEKSPIFLFKHDSFCNACHGGGVVLTCESCWRVSHAACCPVDAPTSRGQFICSMCLQLRTTKPIDIDLQKLNRLLIFIICILRERFKEHRLDPDRLNQPSYRVLMFKHVSFETIEDKIIQNSYKTPLEFLNDIQTLFHCFVLASGAIEFNMTADLLYNYAHYELDELEICPTCYLLSNMQPENWYSIPCSPPHRLVYAKQKGYSFWPAKVMRTVAQGEDNEDDESSTVDVRYFGGNHERAFIEPDCLKSIEYDVAKLVPKRTLAFNKAMDELAIYQEYFMAGPSRYAPLIDSLWSVTDWRAELEKEKAHKALVMSGAVANNKNKKARNKSIPSASHRSTPTPTNSNSALNTDADSRDASVSDLLNESCSVLAASPNLAVLIPSKTPASIRRAAKSEAAEKQAPAQPNTETLKPIKKPPGSDAKSSIKPAVKACLPAISTNESSSAKALSPSSQKLSSALISNKVPTSSAKESKREKLPKSPVKVETATSPVSPLALPKHSGPCPPGSLCAEAYDRKLAQVKADFEMKIKLLQEKMDNERRNDQVLAERRLAEEIAKLQKQQVEEITAVKKKQWCVNCSQEAFFPCCWNTAYCSQHCQQEHWYHEHKRFCRRRRTQDNSSTSAGANSSTTNGATSGSQMPATVQSGTH